eukprot:GHVN01076682.1.p1 GENE.GHVN01076682.1~~GHVN01076682.1.p1  ORF type:complete len:755 (+),score=141.95 GHVN01076682.1:320-2266(+)
MAEKGIGVHHGGLLPIVKEMVEILFGRGLIRVLFATETFAMGVNMPARSVVFTSIRKHDGFKHRTLLASEYTQMSGRAGRRGIDLFGDVYIFAVDEPPEQQALSAMLVEKANPLFSKFRLTYQMMLQLCSRSGLKISDMIGRSYMESVRARRLPIYRRNLQRFKKALAALPEVNCIYGEPTIEEYTRLEKSSTRLTNGLHRKIHNFKSSSSVFSTGRIVVAHSLQSVVSATPAVIIRVSEEDPFTSPSTKSGVKVSGMRGVLGGGGVTSFSSHTSSLTSSAFSSEQEKPSGPFFTLLTLLPAGFTPPPIDPTSSASFMPSTSRRETPASEPPSGVVCLGTYAAEVTVDRGGGGGGRASESAHGDVFGRRRVDIFGGGDGDKDGVAEGLSAGNETSEYLRYYRIDKGVRLEQIRMIAEQCVSKTRIASLSQMSEEEMKIDTLTVQMLAVELNRIVNQENPSTDKKSKPSVGLTPLKMTKGLKQVEMEFYEALVKQKDITESLSHNKCHNCVLKESHMSTVCDVHNLEQRINHITHLLDEHSLELYSEMEAKLAVLRSKGFIDDKNQVTVKGEFAREVTTTDELTLTEAIFDNILHAQSPQDVAAILSCFVYGSSSSSNLDGEGGMMGPTAQVAEARLKIEQIHQGKLMR